MIEGLKPCPFCSGSKCDLAQLLRRICVQCPDCEGSGPWVTTPEEAVAAWNRRTSIQAAAPVAPESAPADAVDERGDEADGNPYSAGRVQHVIWGNGYRAALAARQQESAR